MKKVIFVFLSVFLLLACQQSDKKINAVTNNEDTQKVEQKYHSASIIPTLDLNKESEKLIRKDDNKKDINNVEQEEVWLESLITATPQEGRELALKISRKTIAAIQTDPAVRAKLRGDYAEDTRQLISSAKVVAIEFQTIAQANNYWREY